MKLSYIATVVGSIVIFAGCNFAPNPVAPENTDTQSQSGIEENTSQEMNASIEVTDPNAGDAMEETDENDAAMEGETTETEDSAERMTAEIASASPEYKAYSASERESLHGSEPYVLFFHANWCPTCRKMDSDLNAQLDTFPEGTKILKADYDTEDDLKDEYDVRVQSTVVVLDANGEVVWQGQDPDFDDFKGYIEDSLA